MGGGRALDSKGIVAHAVHQRFLKNLEEGVRRAVEGASRRWTQGSGVPAVGDMYLAAMDALWPVNPAAAYLLAGSDQTSLLPTPVRPTCGPPPPLSQIAGELVVARKSPAEVLLLVSKPRFGRA
jgi:hypothetical protein